MSSVVSLCNLHCVAGLADTVDAEFDEPCYVDIGCA